MASPATLFRGLTARTPVVIQTEAASHEGHLLGVDPVGDEHLMGVKESRHCAAQ